MRTPEQKAEQAARQRERYAADPAWKEWQRDRGGNSGGDDHGNGNAR